MEEYVLLMRLDILTKDAQPSPEQMQEYMKQYQRLGWWDCCSEQICGRYRIIH